MRHGIAAAVFMMSAQPAAACDGCRVQNSPAFFHGSTAFLLGGLAYLALWVAGRRGRAAVLAAACLAGFLAVFALEAALWALAGRDAISHSVLNRMHQPAMFLAWSGLVFAVVAAGAGAGHLGFHPELEDRLSHPLWALCPVAGLPAFAAIFLMSASTTGPGGPVAIAAAAVLWALLAALPAAVCRRKPALAPIVPGLRALRILLVLYAVVFALVSARGLSRVPGTSEQLLATRPETGYSRDVALSPDGRSLSVLGGGEVLAWSVPEGRQIHRSTLAARLRPVALSPDRALAVEFTTNFTPALIHAADGRSQHAWPAHEYPLECAAFSLDGKTVAVGALYGSAFAWDVASGRELARVKPSGFHVSAVALSPDGRLLATASEDRAIRLFEISSAHAAKPLEVTFGVSERRVLSVAFSPDGARLAALLANQDVLVWDVRSGSRLHALDFTEHQFVTAIGFAPDGQLLGASSDLVANDRFRLGVFRLIREAR